MHIKDAWQQHSAVVPSGIIGEILIDLSGSEIELFLVVFVGHKTEHVATVIPAMN